MARRIERVLLVLCLVAVAWLASSVVSARERTQELGGRVAELEVRVRTLTDAAKVARTVPTPPLEAFQPAAKAEGAKAGKGRPGPAAKARDKNPPVPGAELLERLYEAADDLAASEQWDDPTYEAVARVFEETSDSMNALFASVKARELTMSAARKEAIAVRDRAQTQLRAALGDEGFAKLKDRIQDDLAEMGPRGR